MKTLFMGWKSDKIHEGW